MKKKRHEILEAKRLKALISDTSTNSLIYDPHSQTTQDLSITTWADYNQHD